MSEPERFYILAHYYRSVLGDPDKALETYTLWSRTYPGSSIPSINSASIRVNLFGQYEAALADAREGVRLAPNSAISNLTLVGTYLGTNRLPEARQALRDGDARAAWTTWSGGGRRSRWRSLDRDAVAMRGARPLGVARRDRRRW